MTEPSGDLRDQRIDYTGDLLPGQLDHLDPFEFFGDWMRAALVEQSAGRLDEASAVALSTAAPADSACPEGRLRVSSRMVLLKSWDRDGFVFFTHHTSTKGRALGAQPQAALLFWWPSLNRQVRIEGGVVAVSTVESADYFARRPRGSQIGAWASHQSQPRSDRQSLVDEVAAAERRFGDGEVPCPPGWGGYRLVPDLIEFWQGQPSRLHDRIEFRRDDERWRGQRLDP